MKNTLLTKGLAGLTTAALLVGSLPVTAFAVTGDQVAADGTYTAEAAIVNDPEVTEGDEWENYSVTVTVTVADGLISSITTTDAAKESSSYLAKAVTKKTGINTLLAGQAATAASVEAWDAVSGATIVSEAVKAAALEALGNASEVSTEPEVTYSYVLMNIPYEKFYENEISDGDRAIDSVSSATGRKVLSMFPASFHVDATKILGITYPVKVSSDTDLSAYTAAEDADSLYSLGEYSYLTLTDEPAVYKEMTVSDGAVSFSATNAVPVDRTDVTASLAVTSKYGDYQLSLSGISYTDIQGVVINTAERSYALRHLENIWKGGSELAWSTGFKTSENHGNDLSYMADYYKDMMGQTIETVTVYAADENGEYIVLNCDIEDIYVPVKVGAAITAENIADTDTELPVTIEGDENGLYTVCTVDGTAVAVANGKADVSALGLTAGTHNVCAVDAEGKYAPITSSFTVTTTDMPAEYDGENALTAADDASAEDFAAYLANITFVSVNGTAYSATGKRAVKVIGTDGAIDLSKTVAAEETSDIDIVVTATGYPELSFIMHDSAVYVLMNIPYEKFYENEIYDGENTVDAVSSATGAKTQMYSMFPGTFRGENGKIEGITYPVRVTAGVDLSAYTAVTDDAAATAEWSAHGTPVSQELSGVECLFVNGEYSYYALTETPSVYKELTAADDGTFSFAASTASVKAGEGVTATLTSSTSYGDFQLSLSGLDYENILGVAANTAERSYAFRQLENIWAHGAQIAWTTGITTSERHGNDLSYMADYYKDMMGQTIESITIYGVDADGNYVTDNYDIDDLYVALKTNAAVTAENILDTDTELPVTVADDTEGVYVVYAVDAAAVSFEDGKADVSELSLTPGTHTVSVSDVEGKYAPITASFTVTTEKMPAAYDEETIALVAAEGATEEEFAAYLKNITKVSVNGTSYNASGRGAVKVIGADGVIDQEKLSYGTNSLVVTATGYPELAFEADKLFPDVQDPSEWYYKMVYWAANAGVTGGFGDGNFKPLVNVTRAQVVAFLYKMEGSPNVDDIEITFSDVSDGDWYVNAVKWAAANHVTNGYGDGKFVPNKECTRAMTVTLIRNYAKNVKGLDVTPTTESAFTDVTEADWFKSSVDWAVENKITSGFGDGKFKPDYSCTRAMMVTFLNKLDKLIKAAGEDTSGAAG